MTYDNIESTIAQVMLVGQKHQAITWTNVDVSSKGFPLTLL